MRRRWPISEEDHLLLLFLLRGLEDHQPGVFPDGLFVHEDGNTREVLLLPIHRGLALLEGHVELDVLLEPNTLEGHVCLRGTLSLPDHPEQSSPVLSIVQDPNFGERGATTTIQGKARSFRMGSRS